MSVLKSLENKIAGLVEGTFSRAFRSEVRPVEIARKLAREMEDHKSFSVSRTYVPNEYRVFLSPRDRERFADYEGALAEELTGYLLEHARRERLVLLTRLVGRLSLALLILARLILTRHVRLRLRRDEAGLLPKVGKILAFVVAVLRGHFVLGARLRLILAELFLGCRDQSEVMLGVLVIVFGGDRIS